MIQSISKFLNFKAKINSIILIFFLISSVDLYSQNEELKGMIRANDLFLRDKEFKHAKTVENYELELLKLKQANDQMKEKYEKYYKKFFMLIIQVLILFKQLEFMKLSVNQKN